MNTWISDLYSVCMPCVYCCADQGRSVRWNLWVQDRQWRRPFAPVSFPAMCSHNLGSRRQCLQVWHGTIADWLHSAGFRWRRWGSIPHANQVTVFPTVTETCNLVFHPVLASCCSFVQTFYEHVSIASYASAGIARAEMSVCPSVCPSHSGIVSKQRKLASWFLHHPRAWTF